MKNTNKQSIAPYKSRAALIDQIATVSALHTTSSTPLEADFWNGRLSELIDKLEANGAMTDDECILLADCTRSAIERD